MARVDCFGEIVPIDLLSKLGFHDDYLAEDGAPAI
jgi:hypothetical protein